MIANETYDVVPLASVRPHPKNARKGDVGLIAQSIETNGFYGTIVVQKSSGFILAGNHRWLAAKQAGLDEVPVCWVDVDDKTARRILLVDNRANDGAGYDDSLLAKLLEDVRNDNDWQGSGYSASDFDELIAKLGNAEFEPGDEDDQGQLDERSKVICPNCQHEFTP